MSDIQDIKQAHPMPEVVMGYGISINRAGFCCCPFHQEKTASMKIYPQSFHCFGCGAGGDVIDFVSFMENCDFKTAFKILGGKYDTPKAQALKAYRRDADRRTKEKAIRRRLEALNDSRAMLSAYRNALAIIPNDSPMTAPLLAQYYNEQLHSEVLEDEYFSVKGGIK